MPSSRSSSSKSSSSTSRHQSKSSSRSRSTSSSSSSSPESDKKSLLKETFLFLGAVAAATFAAHKYWPKGVIYGDKEHWEHEHDIKQAKRALREARGDDGDKSRRWRRGGERAVEEEDEIYLDREERRARYRQAARGTTTTGRPASVVGSEAPLGIRDRERTRGASRDRSRERERPRSDPGARDGYMIGRSSRESSRERSAGVVVERRRDSYYPPPPRRRYYEYEETPVKVYRAPSTRSRRSSVDYDASGRWERADTFAR